MFYARAPHGRPRSRESHTEFGPRLHHFSGNGPTEKTTLPATDMIAGPQDPGEMDSSGRSCLAPVTRGPPAACRPSRSLSPLTRRSAARRLVFDRGRRWVLAFSRVRRNKRPHGGSQKEGLLPSKVSTPARPEPRNPSGHPHALSPTMIAPQNIPESWS